MLAVLELRSMGNLLSRNFGRVRRRRRNRDEVSRSVVKCFFFLVGGGGFVYQAYVLSYLV